MFFSVRQCAETMTQLFRLKVKVTLQGHDITLHRVPTSTGKPGKSQIKVPCMEKSWNLKTTEKSWKNHGIL